MAKACGVLRPRFVICREKTRMFCCTGWRYEWRGRSGAWSFCSAQGAHHVGVLQFADWRERIGVGRGVCARSLSGLRTSGGGAQVSGAKATGMTIITGAAKTAQDPLQTTYDVIV